MKRIHARWIIPVVPQGQVLEHHAVVVNGERIEAILTDAAAREQYPQAEEVVLPDHALIPGLINGHTHAAMSLMRGMADDLPLMTWLHDHVWPVEGAMLSHEFVADGTRLALLEMIRGGTTTFADMYFFPEAAIEATLEAGLNGVFGLVVIDFPNPWSESASDALRKGIALHDRYHDHPRIDFALAPHAPYTVGDDALRSIRNLADQLDLPVHMHIHETAAEVDGAVKEHGQRPLARLDELGLINERLIAVHMTQLLDSEIERLAETGAHVLHSPQSNLKLASGFCPTAKLIEAGVTVGLGTDGAASNNDLDMFDEMRTAALIAKPVAGSAEALSAEQTLEMATLGSARAFGLDERLGSLEVGKQADLVAVNLNTPETTPVYHPISHLVYAVGRHQVSDVWVAGKPLMRERRLRSIDAEAILARAHDWAARIRQLEEHSS